MEIKTGFAHTHYLERIAQPGSCSSGYGDADTCFWPYSLLPDPWARLGLTDPGPWSMCCPALPGRVLSRPVHA